MTDIKFSRQMPADQTVEGYKAIEYEEIASKAEIEEAKEISTMFEFELSEGQKWPPDIIKLEDEFDEIYYYRRVFEHG